jgi:hypothetical protein
MAYLGGEAREQAASSKGDESHSRYRGPIAFWPRAPCCSGRDDGRSARHGGSQAGTQAYRAEFAAACPICGEPADGPGSWANGHTADDRASFDAYLEELARHCGVCNGRR